MRMTTFNHGLWQVQATQSHPDWPVLLPRRQIGLGLRALGSKGPNNHVLGLRIVVL